MVMGEGNETAVLLEAVTDRIEDELYAMWILVGAFLVFFMQAGFALLEAGTVQEKATKNILLKNILDACIGGVLWWSVGHSFAFGEDGHAPNPFIGGKHFFSTDASDHPDSEVVYHAKWIFSWTFAATAATIVSGAVAERCMFTSYLIYTTAMTGLVYPVVVHWVWSREGWLSPFRDDSTDHVGFHLGGMGVMDFSGAGVVHITGGGAALVAAWILGPRTGRFDDQGNAQELKSYSLALATMGTFILWFSWYGFNGASIHCFFGCIDVAASIAVNTTLSACSSGVIVLIVSVLSGRPGDVAPVLNGILAGLVSITASCAMIEPYAACVIGLMGGLIYFISSSFLLHHQIDDPLDAAPVHFFCGMWGLMAVGIFATESGVKVAYDRDDAPGYGFLYGGGGSQFGHQLLGAIVISCWTLVLNFALFKTLSRLHLFRLIQEDEAHGLGDFGISINAGTALGKDMRMITASGPKSLKVNYRGGTHSDSSHASIRQN